MRKWFCNRGWYESRYFPGVWWRPGRTLKPDESIDDEAVERMLRGYTWLEVVVYELTGITCFGPVLIYRSALVVAALAYLGWLGWLISLFV